MNGCFKSLLDTTSTVQYLLTTLHRDSLSSEQGQEVAIQFFHKEAEVASRKFELWNAGLAMFCEWPFGFLILKVGICSLLNSHIKTTFHP